MNRNAVAAQDAQPEVAKNTGSAGLVASTGTTPSRARAVADQPARQTRVDAGRGDEKERPILFSASMVRAILDGRKTQTRRIVKLKLNDCGNFLHAGNDALAHQQIGEFREQDGRWFGLAGYTTLAHAKCPYGQPGDHLWVRETTINVEEHGYQGPVYVESEEGRSVLDFGLSPAPDDMTEVDPSEIRKRPAIHMPRSMSRILLEIVAVRVERLNDINRADAIAEGGQWNKCPTHQTRESTEAQRAARRIGMAAHYEAEIDYVGGYRWLWESINGPGTWAANPWVWVVEFKRVTP